MRWKGFFVQQIVLMSALVLNVTLAHAQSEAVVHGQIVAAADGSALAQGRVVLKSISTEASTETTVDPAGRFTFQDVSPGEYVVSGSSEGFANREVRIVLKSREIRAVTLALDVRSLDVSITVTADVPSLPGAHSPSSTTLTADRLESLPVSQRMTFSDAVVTAAPGMIRGHDDFVHIRGEEVALNPFINGVGFWENPHAVFSAGFSPDVIETANVMTGGFPAEYGNRFGGVVDIVTKSGLRMDHRGSVTLNGGEAGRRNVLGDFGGRRNRIGYYVFGSLFESDRFLSPPDPEAIHDHARGGHVFFQLDGNLGHAGLLRAVVMGDGTNFEIPKTPVDVQLRPLADANQRTRQQTAIVGWTHASSNTTVRASFYQRWSRSQLSPAAGPLTARAEVERELTTIGGKVDVTRLAGRHAIKAGLDAVSLRPHEDLAYNYGGFRDFAHLVGLPHIHITDNVINFAGSESGGQVSGYLQDSVQISDRVTADVGLRVDRYDLLLAATHASPRLNLAVQVGGGAVVHASYNSFFVPPPIEGVLSSGAGLTQRIAELGVALPAVQPTTEHQFEVGASAPAGPLQLGLTGYYRASDNPVHTTVWPDARIYSYASFDRARAYGLEAKAEIPRLARYGATGYFNYALGRVYFYNPVTGGFVTEAEHLEATNRFLAPMDQTHTLTAGLTYRHARTGVFAGTAMDYGSGTPMEHGAADEHADGEADHTHAVSAEGAARVPAHFTANISLGIDLLRRANSRRKLSLQLDIENIANNTYLVAQEGEFTPGQYSIPRLIAATVKIRF
jgi:TonB-dependent receptor-like protein/carboxypeptidase family protein